MENWPIKNQDTLYKLKRTGGTKWTYHKERSFATTYIFLKFNFSVRTSHKKLT